MAASAIGVDELRRSIAAHIRRTPMLPRPGGGFVKLESLQPTGSFKVRGFFAAALALEPERLRRGLLTVSAGNAALACAYVARELGVPCRVVMFDTAPRLKADGVRALGAEILPMPRDALYEWMRTRGWEREPETFIHPFADDMVMAGHGTLMAEIWEDLPDVERLLVPVGGGGLVCGIAAARTALGSTATVAGVQSGGYPLWPHALRAGGPVSLTPATIADGTMAPFDAGMFSRLQSAVDDWVVIAETELRAAVARLATEMKVVAEGSGALAYAALLQESTPEKTVAVVSGGNIDGTLLADLLTTT